MLKWKSFNREFPREYLLRSSARRGGLFLDCVLDLKTNKQTKQCNLLSLCLLDPYNHLARGVVLKQQMQPALIY